MGKVDEGTKACAVERYSEGETVESICNDLGIKSGTLYAALKEKGVPLRGWKTKQVDEEGILEGYRIGKSVLSLAREFGSYEKRIKKILRDNGVAVVERRYRRSNFLQEDFFEKIDSEDKAYWLGFILADGNVNRTSIRIKLAECDEEHLSKFYKSVQYDGPLFRGENTHGFSGGTGWVEALVTSAKMRDDLAQYGIIPNKTNAMNKLDLSTIPPHLFRHFWRGVVDGDGWFYARVSGSDRAINLTFGVGVMGHPLTCRAFKDWTENIIGPSPKIHSKGVASQVEINHRDDAMLVLHTLYLGNKISLTRKQEKYEKVKEEYRCLK